MNCRQQLNARDACAFAFAVVFSFGLIAVVVFIIRLWDPTAFY